MIQFPEKQKAPKGCEGAFQRVMRMSNNIDNIIPPIYCRFHVNSEKDIFLSAIPWPTPLGGSPEIKHLVDLDVMEIGGGRLFVLVYVEERTPLEDIIIMNMLERWGEIWPESELLTLREELDQEEIMENLPQVPGPCSDIPETRREAWREAWLKMRPWVKSRTPISEIAKLMKERHPSLKANDRETVRKIVKAGKAGCFE